MALSEEVVKDLLTMVVFKDPSFTSKPLLAVEWLAQDSEPMA